MPLICIISKAGGILAKNIRRKNEDNRKGLKEKILSLKYRPMGMLKCPKMSASER